MNRDPIVVELLPLDRPTRNGRLYDTAQIATYFANERVQQRIAAGLAGEVSPPQDMDNSDLHHEEFFKRLLSITLTRAAFVLKKVWIKEGSLPSLMGEIVPSGPNDYVLRDLIAKGLPLEFEMRATTSGRGPYSLLGSLITFDLVLPEGYEMPEHPTKTKIKARQHRGQLSDSMATEREIEPTMDALVQYLKDDLFLKEVFTDEQRDALVTRDNIKIQYYTLDLRIHQPVYIVSVLPDFPVAAMIDGLPVDYKAPEGQLQGA